MVGLFSFMTQAGAAALKVTVTSVNGSDGYVMVGLYESEKSLEESSADRHMQVQAIPGSVTVIFEDVQPGVYAVNSFHDANANGEMEVNALGIPQEGYGFANDARGMLGAPSFEDASITVGADDLEISFELGY